MLDKPKDAIDEDGNEQENQTVLDTQETENEVLQPTPPRTKIYIYRYGGQTRHGALVNLQPSILNLRYVRIFYVIEMKGYILRNNLFGHVWKLDLNQLIYNLKY